MKYIGLLTLIILMASCKTSIKLQIPDAFEKEAYMEHVKGSRKRKMSFGNFNTSKIKRGANITYPGWARFFFIENLALSLVGIQASENITKRKFSFNYTLSNGNQIAKIYGKEKEITNVIKYSTKRPNKILNSISDFKSYNYIFGASICTNTLDTTNNIWQLFMSNAIDKTKSKTITLFQAIYPDEAGIVTNGKDTIAITPLDLRNSESPKGINAKLPFKVLSGYELTTTTGLIAIIDYIGHNIWYYNKLNDNEKLLVSSVATALFARRLNDAQW